MRRELKTARFGDSNRSKASLGYSRLEFGYPYGMAAAVIKPESADLIIDSPSPSMRVHLDREQYRLGRSSLNELAFLEDQKLSREHLVFDRTPGGWTVRDVGSRNGTHINRVRLIGTAGLSHGDRITAGHLTIRYDARREFADAGLNAITFVEQPLEGPAAAVSIDLKAALDTSTSVAGLPSLENEHLGALVRAGRELAGHGDLEKLFEIVLELSLRAVKASRGVVVTRDSEGNLRSRAMRGEGLRISTAVRDLVMNEGRSLLVRDARLDQDFGSGAQHRGPEIRSILAVPLQTDERIIGLLYLDSPRLVREFTAEDLNLVTVMANIAAIRIEHARLMGQEQARKLMARRTRSGGRDPAPVVTLWGSGDSRF